MHVILTISFNPPVYIHLRHKLLYFTWDTLVYTIDIWTDVCVFEQWALRTSVANLAILSQYLATFQTKKVFFPKKRLATNLETSWTNFSESLWLLVLPQRREISAYAALSLHLLCSVSVWEEQPVQLKQILCCFSNFTCKHSRSHITGIVFVLSYLVCIILFHQTTAQ